MFKNLLKEYQEGYVYLFSDRSFYTKLWIIPFLLFFPFIKYPFGIIFIKGWQIQMVEDIMLDKPLQSLQIKKIVLKGFTNNRSYDYILDDSNSFFVIY